MFQRWLFSLCVSLPRSIGHLAFFLHSACFLHWLLALPFRPPSFPSLSWPLLYFISGVRFISAHSLSLLSLDNSHSIPLISPRRPLPTLCRHTRFLLPASRQVQLRTYFCDSVGFPAWIAAARRRSFTVLNTSSRMRG